MLAQSADDAWIELLRDCLRAGETVNPRGLLSYELIAKQSCVDMCSPIVTVEQRSLGYRFLFAEAFWILTGDSRVKTIAPYSRHIAQFSDDEYRFQGAYGPMILEQIRYVTDTLLKDPSSRQAVLTIWRPNPRDSKDIPCTVAGQWLIRNNHLHYIHTMRSSDLWLGWPYDVFNFSALSYYLSLRLKERGYKEPLYLGNLYFTAGSQHLYERNYEGAKSCSWHPDTLPYNPIFDCDHANSEQFLSDLEHLKDSDDPLDAKIQYLRHE